MTEQNTTTEVRTNKRKNAYVMIDNAFFEDTRLSWKAKGLMGYLLSRPDNWKINHKDLVNRSKDGKDAVTSTLQELQNVGYIHYFQERAERGKFGKWIWDVYETPLDNPHYKPHTENPHTVEIEEKPHTDSPHTEKPHTENPHYNNTNLNNTDLNNKDLKQDDDDNAQAREQLYDSFYTPEDYLKEQEDLERKKKEQNEDKRTHLNDMFKAWDKHIKTTIKPHQAQQLHAFVSENGMEENLVCEAIERSIGTDYPAKHAIKILNKWLSEGSKTFQQMILSPSEQAFIKRQEERELKQASGTTFTGGNKAPDVFTHIASGGSMNLDFLKPQQPKRVNVN